MAFCLPREFSERFLSALKEGKIVPEKMAEMTSAERRIFFDGVVGPENSAAVNAMFESKLLLKDQKRGLVTWAKNVAGLKETARKDLLSKIERLEKVLSAEDKAKFLDDLASQKIGADVSFEEAQEIIRLSKEVREFEAAIPPGAADNSVESIAYGMKYVEFQNLIRSLKKEDFNFLDEVRAVDGMGSGARVAVKSVIETAGTAKSLLSAFDNSFFGRQGLPVLMTHPTLWAKNFMKSWADMGKELAGYPQMDIVKAQIAGRKLARDGTYDRFGIDIGLNAEEAFPSSLPGKIPILGRLYKASETAFQAGALRMRADLADRMAKNMEDFGINLAKDDLKPVGSVINSMTGRGGLGGMSESTAKAVNVLLFSPRFLSGNWNTLTAHTFGMGLKGKSLPSQFARREAARNIAKIMAVTAGTLTMYNMLRPGSVEFDSRSSKFGKIQVGDTYFDITGGKGSLTTLLSRANPFMPTKHGNEGGFYGNGIGYWSKSATTGKWTDLSAGKYGQQSALDTLWNFFEGKFSPGAGILRDVLSGKNFQGEKPTPASVLLGATVPLPVQSAIQRKVDLNDPVEVAGLILEGLGLSATSYEKKK